MIQVIEVQNEDTTRVYNLEGPRLDTVVDFWEYLVANGVIESYNAKELN